jgi:hypothetical protein
LVQAQLSAANDAVGWFRILDGLRLTRFSSTTATLAALLQRLCVTVDPFDARVVPEDVAPGQFAELRVRAGLTFRNANLIRRAMAFAPPLEVQATATGTEEPIDGGPTDAQGIFHGPLRRFGDAPVAIAVRACIVQAQFPHLRAVCGATDLTAGATTTTSTSTTTTTSMMAPTDIRFSICVEGGETIVCELDLPSYDAVAQKNLNPRVRVSLLDQNGQTVIASVHVTVDPPPPPPLASCPSCGKILGLDENGNMAGPTFTYVTPCGSGAATITLETTLGGVAFRHDLVITFNSPVRPPVMNVSATDLDGGGASASGSGQVGDRCGDVITLTFGGAPPNAEVLLNGPVGAPDSVSVFIAPGGPFQPPPGTYVTTFTAMDARGLSSSASVEFTASDGGDHVVVLNPAPAN